MAEETNDSVTVIEGIKVKNSERTQCEVWTRVMGYFRPFSQFNKGKKSEFKDRQWFVEGVGCPCSSTKKAA